MKHISSPVENMLKPVKVVSGIVERNQSLPVVSNILIEQKDTRVTFSTTDLDIQIRTTAEVGVPGVEGSFTVSAQKTSEILSALRPLDTIDVNINDEGQAEFVTSNGRFTMQTLPAQDFPVISTSNWTCSFAIPAKTLRYLLTMTSFAMASKDHRYFLMGVLFVVEGSKLRCVATDTHRLAYCEAEVDGLNQETKVEAIVARKTVRELLRILPEDDTPVSVNLADTQIGLSFAGIDFVSKLIDGRFPDYQRVMPTEQTNPQCVRINREELLLALRRVQILTNEKFHGIRWLFSQGQLLIQGNNAEQEEARQTLTAPWTWPELDIGFNLIYMIELLTNLKNSEVDFHFAPTPKSVLVTMPESENFRYLIMPMRI
ncbi:DNA polymerase III subunit beta [Sutterella sp.]|uniref:DNA polymerase III subunit beta n=1 Tax=Sutterella sp. TaxID=1981025 RepID=UPI0026E1006B|nr:DNA polymerase III subunit beta [Sutterella sp.]MDO5530430.1 DNA polymerase III subunit beta [Sutterella sp.]